MFNLDNQNRYLKIYILELTNVYATDDCVSVSINWLSSLIQRKVKFLSTCGENMIIYLHFKDFEDESEDKDNKIRRRLLFISLLFI